MEAFLGVGFGGSGDERDDQNSQGERRPSARHTSYQTIRLEEIFNETPHPDENRRRSVAEELGLEPKQVKFWFQNRRTAKKSRSEREDNDALRSENEMIQRENLQMKEFLKNIMCSTCGVPYAGDLEHALTVRQLRLDNTRLKQEFEKVSTLLARHVEKPISQPELHLGPPSQTNTYDYSQVSARSLQLALATGGPSSLSLGGNLFPGPRANGADLDRALMREAATAANKELLMLLCTNDPLWVKSQTSCRRQVLSPMEYDELFPRVNHFKTPTARVESSKESRIVRIEAIQLVDMMLDSEKWTNLFSTIVSKALTLNVIDKGLPETRHQALQLMYEEMHTLSPLVQPRELYILRYCHQLEPTMWVITDVSFDYIREETLQSTRVWKRPSGCMIHALPDGTSRITWVEHVEVDDIPKVHPLFRDIVVGGIGYGTERWLMELQRMCDRSACTSFGLVPSYDLIGGGITYPEGRRSLMRLSQRMVRGFSEAMNMSPKLDLSQHSIHEGGSNSGIRISIRRNTTAEGLPAAGTIVVVATTVWLPFASQNLYDFFKDARTRFQWDALCAGRPLLEVGHVSTGTHPGNYISIIRSVNPKANAVLIVQESFIHPLGAYVVYTPITAHDFKRSIQGDESVMVSVLPSGLTISEDGRLYSNNGGASTSGREGARPRGSLLTITFQLLTLKTLDMVNMEWVTCATSLVNGTIQRIKTALNCPNTEY